MISQLTNLVAESFRVRYFLGYFAGNEIND